LRLSDSKILVLGNDGSGKCKIEPVRVRDWAYNIVLNLYVWSLYLKWANILPDRQRVVDDVEGVTIELEASSRVDRGGDRVGWRRSNSVSSLN